jgi:hypothetical protein
VADIYTYLRDSLAEGPKEEFIDNQINWIAFILDDCSIPEDPPGYGRFDGFDDAVVCLTGHYEKRIKDIDGNKWRDLRAYYESTLTIESRKAIQSALYDLGYYSGAIDARFGVRFREALTEYQQDNGLLKSGFVEGSLVSRLGLAQSISFVSSSVRRAPEKSYSPPTLSSKDEEVLQYVLGRFVLCAGKKWVTSKIKSDLGKTLVDTGLSILIGDRPDAESMSENYIKNVVVRKLKESGRSDEAELLKDASFVKCVLKGLQL